MSLTVAVRLGIADLAPARYVDHVKRLFGVARGSWATLS